jgi:hypothetical protein
VIADGRTRLEKLLLSYTGVVDINSSSHGQPSYYDATDRLGGWFTSILCAHLQNSGDWKALFLVLCRDTNHPFGHPELIQVPQAFCFDVKPMDEPALADDVWGKRKITRQTMSWTTE